MRSVSNANRKVHNQLVEMSVDCQIVSDRGITGTNCFDMC